VDDLEDEILIGEGVRLTHGSAPVSIRMFSSAIDLLATVLLAIGVYQVTEPLYGGNAAQQRVLAIVTFVLVFVTVPATVETVTRGLSLGRWALGLRIVRDDGGPIAARQAVLRAFAGVLEIYMTLGILAFSVGMLSRRGKRIGDFLAGTYALRTRVRARPLLPVKMPEHLRAWASTAVVVRLPDGLALSCRLFLERRRQLSPQSAERLGARLAGRLEPLVAPAPPPGTSPEDFIGAVIAERGEREYRFGLEQARRRSEERLLLERLPYGIADARD
jgi:uncharacterized RDD family membrane protein YckC